MVLLIAKNFQFVKFSQADFGIKTKHPAECYKLWRGAFRTQLSEERAWLSRTVSSNLTTQAGETKKPHQHFSQFPKNKAAQRGRQCTVSPCALAGRYLRRTNRRRPTSSSWPCIPPAGCQKRMCRLQSLPAWPTILTPNNCTKPCGSVSVHHPLQCIHRSAKDDPCRCAFRCANMTSS